jgi:hypothetical protein
VRRAPATASGSNVTSSRPPRSTSPVRATRAGRALFPLPKNIGALSDPRTALVVRSGREVKRDVFMRELNLLLGTSMAPDDLSVALASSAQSRGGSRRIPISDTAHIRASLRFTPLSTGSIGTLRVLGCAGRWDSPRREAHEEAAVQRRVRRCRTDRTPVAQGDGRQEPRTPQRAGGHGHGSSGVLHASSTGEGWGRRRGRCRFARQMVWP